jgi:hypothetical protein
MIKILGEKNPVISREQGIWHGYIYSRVENVEISFPPRRRPPWCAWLRDCTSVTIDAGGQRHQIKGVVDRSLVRMQLASPS